jgi:flagellar biosynthetic protein FlhB
VALRYDETRNRAPVVVAKGTDLLPARIREIAAETACRWSRRRRWRALYRSVELSKVPAALTPPWQVLTYVYQLGGHGAGQSRRRPR